MRRFVRENALTLVMAVLFALSLAGQALAGWQVYNAEQVEHGAASVDVATYLAGTHFGEAVFENWESEFLQMGLFVLLTARLRQKGSPESKPLDEDDPHETDRELDPNRPGAPWPVRRGGAVAWLYSHSLSIALLGLFALSFALHVVNGAAELSADLEAHVRAQGYTGDVRLGKSNDTPLRRAASGCASAGIIRRWSTTMPGSARPLASRSVNASSCCLLGRSPSHSK